MAYTKEEWEWIKDRLVPNCTAIFYYRDYINPYPIKINQDKTATFRPKASNQSWDLCAYSRSEMYGWKVVDFKWPDGSPMIPFVEYDGKPYNPVLAKWRLWTPALRPNPCLNVHKKLCLYLLKEKK